jgi:16S rRNA (uracil1498-N3)-methyltransferase
MAERFYVNCPLQPGLVGVEGPEAHHLAVVCRVRPGDPVRLFNGDGREYPARVAEVARRRVTLDVLGIEAPRRELGFRLEVAAPLPRGDRAQFLVEKLTELGATAFVPLRTARSVVHPRDTRLDKLHRHVIEASKQCGRNVLMTVGPLAEWETYCRRGDLPATRRLAHPGESQAIVDGRLRMADWNAPHSGLALAVGPEGGFTNEEVVLARSVGWQVVGLGPRILRVETAALVLAAWAVQAAPVPAPPGEGAE